MSIRSSGIPPQDNNTGSIKHRIRFSHISKINKIPHVIYYLLLRKGAIFDLYHND
jgi:hypothetical protein